jgi:hypothetical protein
VAVAVAAADGEVEELVTEGEDLEEAVLEAEGAAGAAPADEIEETEETEAP